MQDLVCYKVLPEWNADTLPKGFRQRHNTKAGTWAKLNIISGKLTYYALDEADNVLSQITFDSQTETPYVEPQAWHRVEPASDDLRVQLSFYCDKADYYQKKYRLSAPHSEMQYVLQHIQAGRALDIGCGGGRNALLLQQMGFEVTALDTDADAIAKLNEIIAQEGLLGIKAFCADIQQFVPSESYDLIISSVMLMFLPSHSIAEVIHKMQSATQSGGYNLIVCAINSADYPLSKYDLPFDFAFKPGELAEYYQGWNTLKYNEDIGHLHRRDAEGNLIALRFATMLAQKV